MPGLSEELNKVLTLGKHTHDPSSSRHSMKQWKECQSDIWREERITFLISVQVFSEPEPARRLPPFPPPSHLFSASPPATHFNLINDPSPTTRLCFYRLLQNVDLLRPVSSQSPTSLVDSLMWPANSSVTSSIWNSAFNAVVCERMYSLEEWETKTTALLPVGTHVIRALLLIDVDLL